MAWSYFRRVWSRGVLGVMVLISVAGIALGVASLVVTLSVMNGFHTEITRRLLALNPHLIIMGPMGADETTRRVEETLEGAEAVESISDFIFINALLYRENASQGAVIKGVEPEPGPLELAEGTWEDLREGGMIIGAELGRKLRVSPGDRIFLVIPEMEGIGVPMVPRVEEFHVSGIFSSGIHEYDSGLAYIDIEAAQGLGGHAVSAGTEVYISDPFEAGGKARFLREALPGSLSVQTWKERNYNLFAALKLEKAMMFIVLVMIVVVAMFNVAGSLIMVSVTRSRDCGVMRAVGATRRQIRLLFNFKGLLIGFFGAVSGTLLGIGLSFLVARYQFIELPPQVYLISTLPVRIEFSDIALVAAVTLGVSFLATLYPAVRAGRMEVAGELRNE